MYLCAVMLYFITKKLFCNVSIKDVNIVKEKMGSQITYWQTDIYCHFLDCYP